ncbi:fibronectin type III domain-containing protein [Cellvibrio sp. PSBB023]|uniref:fibronectin type III domain-containing protein n=1 Tax=Cellvibrio sp. PSBB023 TaxID=1945512 RepID=UPI0009C3C1EC|nr:fibronectin type III domain-containing protein [Cellvibrio sp. PSBB023]AQT59139.1 hypothetical protein B0D95_02845 [Cellvibrio sp. PSBB023]
MGTSPNLTITGYRDGSSVASDSINTGASDSSGSVTYTKNGVGAGFGGTLTFNADWQYIDEIRFTGNNTAVAIDDIDFEPGVLPDSTPPTVTSITSSTPNGTYKIGSPISIQVNFDEIVNVTGTPQLTLETGATDRTINYTSGTGSSTLTFTYTVQAGDVSADLDYISTTALTLNGSTIRDAAGNNAILTLATPGAANSLGNNKALVIDGVAPTVTSVNSSTANGTYKIGDLVSVQVNFSEAVTVTGTPQLTLETGTTDQTINYTNGSGTSSLTFSYTVQAGDNSSDLDYVATSSLTLGGGTIRDAAGNDATLTLASPGAANSLGNNKALVIDGVVPSVSSIVVSGSPTAAATSVNFTVTFSESVTGVSTDDFALGTTGTASGTIASVSGSGSSFTVTVNGIVGNGTIKVNLNGSTDIVDAAGNVSPAAYTSGTTHTVAIPTAPDAPTIGAATPGDGQVSVAFTAPVNNGGSAITGYTVTSNPGGFTGGGNGFTTSPITVNGLTNGTAYTFTVTATNGVGTSTVSGISNSATPKGSQTITFPNPGTQNFGTAPDLSPTASTTSSLTVSFTSSTTGVCTITSDGALTFVTAGSCTIDADQAGDDTWNAATTVTQTFTVNAVVPDAPTIGTATAGDTEATVTFTAPASTGGAAIFAGGYTVTASPGGATATGSSSPITVTGLMNGVAYTFTVTATNSAGEGNPSAATNSVTPAAPQTITFADPGAQNYGTAPTLTASSSAGVGYGVTFTSATTSVCTVNSAGVLTFISAGTCTINADQAGDSSFLPAPQVSRTFTVNPVVSAAPTIGTAIAGDTQASVAFTPPINTGGTSITNYTVTVSPPDVAPINGASSPIVVTGLTNGQAYTFTVTADNSAGTSPASVASNPITPKSIQTVTFANPGPRNFGTAPTLIATTDATGLTPTFTSSTPAVCTITSGGTLTFVSTGTCTINADQAGDASYLAAPQVTNSFTVNAVVPGAPTIGTATAGSAQASIAFTAPAFNGGSLITGYTVTASPGGATATGASSPITFTGLNNGTSYTFTVSATNAVGTGSPSTSSNAVTPNGAPIISGTPALSVNQDAVYSFIPTATDTAGDTLTFSITNKPTWAVFDTVTGALTGTPTNADVGVTNGIVISVSDGTLSASLPAFNLTVVNVNEAPVISGTPATSVDQDVAYSFIPTASDVDVDDVLTFSITNKPTWASFNPATGALTGTPTNADVGVTSGIVISVSDGTLSASLPAFNLTVVNVNDVPVISGTPATSVDQDVAYSFIPTASDVDVGDVLTFSITNKPTWAMFDSATGALTGTPAKADVGTTTGIIISVSDGTLSASLPAFDLVVGNVNEAPVISGTPATSVDQDVAYSFIPTASDVDVGDALTFSITNKPSWASFNPATGALTGTPTGADVGTTTGIVISVSDGTLSASLPAFTLEVVATIDPLQPVVTAPDDITINATGLYTPVSLRQLLSLNPAATQEQVEAILNSMASDGVSGNTCCTTNPEGLNANNVLLLPPGRHEVTWKATNAADVSGTATQVVSINPLVSLSKSQIAIRGSAVEFRVLLNGKAPQYPLSVPYVIDTNATTAASTEHNLVNGTANFAEEGQVQVAIPVQIANLSGLTDSQLVVRLGSDINAGVANSHTISIREGNIPPSVTLGLTQGGINTIQITPTGGPVTVTATVTDLNPGDTHTYDWSASDTVLGDTDGNPVNNTLVFDPSNLSGRHQAQLTVTDSGGASANVQLFFRIVASLPVLSPDVDTDGDGISDLDEGLGDSNGNGIPDYLDSMPTTNILPQQGAVTNAYLIECDPGVRCGLGKFALVGQSGGVQILDNELGAMSELIVDPTFKPVGGIFDFVINDLPTPGQNVRIVIPQASPIPANAVYRKYQNGNWVNFQEDTNNTIFSAPGNPGYCPPPGNAEWTPGLTQGNLCVQLTITDGGPNDDDGLVNSAIVDPGAVSVALPVDPEPPTPEPPKPDVSLKSKGGGAVDGVWILLIGSLLMMKWIGARQRKSLLTAALLVTSVSSQALTDGKAFVRVDVYKVEGGTHEAAFSQTLAAAGHDFRVDRYDVDRRGYQIALGYQWHDYTYTELGFLELGDVNVDMTLDGDTDLVAFKRDFADAYPVSASGWTAVQGLTLFSERPINLSLEAGAYFWQDDRKTNQAQITLQSDSGVAPLAGVRMDWLLTKSISMGFNARRIYLGDQVVDLYSLSGRYRF